MTVWRTRLWARPLGRYAGLFVLACLVRLAIVALFATVPVNDLLWNEAVATNLANGHGFTASQMDPRIPAVFRGPVYPAFVAAIYVVWGHSYYAVYVVQAALDALTAVVLVVLARRLVSERVAWLAGLLYATYPYASMFCGVLHQDVLLVFVVLVGSLLVATAAGDPARVRWWGAAGLVLGVATLIKGNLIVFVAMPAAVIALARQSMAARARALILVVAGVLVMVLPWTVRNYVAFHQFVPVAIGGLGADAVATLREMDAGRDDTPGFPSRDYSPEAEADSTRSTRAVSDWVARNPQGADSIALERRKLAEALPQILDRWPEYLRLVFARMPRLWLTGAALGYRPVVAAMARVLSWIYVVPALVGLLLLARQWRRLLILYATVVLFTVMYAFYFAEARYTLPARPAMMVFVAVVLDRLAVWAASIRRGTRGGLSL